MEDGLIACICEGAAEQAIMEILLEHEVIKFSKDQLLDEKVIRVRSAKNFEQQYLGKSFCEKITIYRILDSRNERFNLSKLYRGKVKVVNVVTAPEIEMLIICNEDKYGHFKNQKMKPSEYCKEFLRYSNVKSYAFIRDYFSDLNTLISAIKKYRSNARIEYGEFTLCDLLNSKFI